MVEGEELDARVDALGGEFGVTEAACGWVVVMIVSNRQREKRREGEGEGKAAVLPGMMYVRERRADSIWATWPAFLVTKWSYVAIHLGGRARAWRTVVVMVFDVVVVVGGVDRLFLLVVSGMMAVRSPRSGHGGGVDDQCEGGESVC